MRRLFRNGSVGLFFLLTFASYAADVDVTIVPGRRAGPIMPNSSESELRRLLGAAQIRQGKIQGGEGYACDGSIIFPNDPTRKANIIWKDVARRAIPFSVEVNGSEHPKSIWKTEEGIRLGTTLKEIEKLNGRPFKLLGFHWDYGGTVVSWEGGRLEKFQTKEPSGHRLILRLEYDLTDQSITEEESGHVSGDKELISSDAVLQKLNPKVYQMDYRFDQSTSCNAVLSR
jgi:hypothetical protein